MHELESLDLNRLLALHWLLEDTQVTRAARHLGTTQPALSRTLRELRQWFGDPLLVRQGRELVRSSFGEALRPRLARAVAELRELARPPGSFDPATACGTFRIACTDYVASMVLSAWNSQVARRAPGLNLELRQLRAGSSQELESETLDMLIRPARHREGDTGFARHAWFEERYASWVRPGHPLAGRRIGWARFAALNHVQVGVGRAPNSEIDRVFRSRGYTRRVAVRVESFWLAARALHSGDCVATLPARLGAEALPALAEVKTPLDVPPFTLDLAWHPRHSGNDRHAFVRRAMSAWILTV